MDRLETHFSEEKIVVALEHINGQHFWDGKNGYASGDAFKAWAKDFPVGAKLIVESTARIELPL